MNNSGNCDFSILPRLHPFTASKAPVINWTGVAVWPNVHTYTPTRTGVIQWSPSRRKSFTNRFLTG